MQRQVVALVLRLPTPSPEIPGKLLVYFNNSVFLLNPKWTCWLILFLPGMETLQSPDQRLEK